METNDIPKEGRISFYTLCKMYNFGKEVLQNLANISGNPRIIINEMFLDHPVDRVGAEKVLTALSQLTGREWNMESVAVKLIGNENQSEVARIREQIRLEYEAVHQALHGLTLGAAQHAFITKRQENIAKRVEELRAVVGEEAAMQMVIALQDQETSRLDEVR